MKLPARKVSKPSANTPEGKVKAKVKQLIDATPATYQFWPVQHGFGAATLDCIGACRGRAFAVETKARGKRPTARQELTIEQMRAAGVQVFVVDGDETLAPLRAFLMETSEA